MNARIIYFFVVLFALFNFSAKAESLVTLLSSYQISITPGYDGGEIGLVAIADYSVESQDEPLDVVVITRGPKREIAVNEKYQSGVFWFSRTIKRYSDLPSFVSVQSSRLIQEIADKDRLTVLSLDTASLFSLRTESFSTHENTLIRLQSENGLWKTGMPIVPITGRIFQGTISVPSSAPTGNYTVDIYLLSRGILLQKNTLNFSIIKEGMSYDIFWMSQAHPFFYGIALCWFSIVAGWVAAMAFRGS